MTDVSQPQHIVEAPGIIRGTSDSGVKQEGNNGTLDIVADGGVWGVFITAVQLYPSIVGRHFHRMDQPPRRRLESADQRRQGLKELGITAKPRPPYAKFGIVGCHTFGDPQIFGIYFALVIKGP